MTPEQFATLPLIVLLPFMLGVLTIVLIRTRGDILILMLWLLSWMMLTLPLAAWGILDASQWSSP